MLFITIESKALGNDLENNIGHRLKDYINDLFKSEPTAFKTVRNREWRFFKGNIVKKRYKLISVGAFLFKNEAELKTHLVRGNLDAIIAFEFGELSILHYISNKNGVILLNYLKTISSEQGAFVIKIHSF